MSILAELIRQASNSIRPVVFAALAILLVFENTKAESRANSVGPDAEFIRVTSGSCSFGSISREDEHPCEPTSKAFFDFTEIIVNEIQTDHKFVSYFAETWAFSGGLTHQYTQSGKSISSDVGRVLVEHKYCIKLEQPHQILIKTLPPFSNLTANLRGSEMPLAENSTIHVSNAAELISALSNASGGETILLEGGDYGYLTLDSNRDAFAKFPSNVTIQSADMANAASFSGMYLLDAENLTFDSIIFDYQAAPGTPIFGSPFMIANSSEITISNSLFDGDLASGLEVQDNGYPTGNGLFVSGSSGIDIVGNEFKRFVRGAIFSSSDELVVSGNEFHGLRSDGLNFAAVQNVLIEDNHFHDFAGSSESADHQDMIQFWTAGTDQPTENIVIRSNVLDNGVGLGTQSIFMRNEAVDVYGAGEEMYYKNITIVNNVILNASSHGITVGEATNLSIENNTILHNKETADAGLVNVPNIYVAEKSNIVNVQNNIVPRSLDISNSSHVYGDNIVVQRDDSGADNYYGDLFVNALADSNASIDDLKVIPNSAAAGHGSTLTMFDETPNNSTGYVITEASEGLSSKTVTFNATNIFGQDGKLDLSDAVVNWDFGDGNSGSGIVVEHSYEFGGRYSASASLTLGDGGTLDVHKVVEVVSPVALNITADNGLVDVSDAPKEVIATSEVRIEDGADGEAIRLNGGNITITQSSDFIGNDEYTFAFDLRQDSGSAESAKLVTFNGSFIFFVENDGLRIAFNTDQGGVWIYAYDIGISDGDWHKVALTFSGKEGKAELYLDGVEVERVDGLAGAVQTGFAGHDIIIGDPFRETSFDGLIDNVTFSLGVAGNLEEGGGNNPLAGGIGDDRYVVDSLADLVIENADEGIDTVRSNVFGYTLADNVENGEVGLVGGSTLSGNALNNTLFGNVGADNLLGNAGADNFAGGGGNDTIDGGTGIDGMGGGLGDDLYFVDNLGDTIFENADEGFDTAYVFVNGYTLHAHVEQAEIRLVGGATLSGNAQDNQLFGSIGDDNLLGNGGNDNFAAGNGNDTIDGGSGIDGMGGGLGDDLYFVDNLSDTIFENAGEGTDSAYVYVDGYTLHPNIEQGFIQLTGGATLSGNAQDNTLIGNIGNDNLLGNGGNDSFNGGAGNDTIDGGAGVDGMGGGTGDDLFFIRDAGDTVFENSGEGTDSAYVYIDGYTLNANVENAFIQGATGRTLSGNEAANSLFGNIGNDHLIGNGGNDAIYGGAGNDTIEGGTDDDYLVGGAGADTFVFNYGDDIDTITDFSTADDLIQLSGYTTTDFTALQALFSDAGANAVITFDASNIITIQGVASNLLMADDFNFV